MQVDKTMQGATEKITGLLNPQEGQSEPEKTDRTTRANTGKTS